MQKHFEQFGEVEEVYVPTPWHCFAFVTFVSVAVAQSLIGKEHNVRGVNLLMKSRQQANKGRRDSEQSEMRRWGSGAMPDHWKERPTKKEVRGRGKFRDRNLEDTVRRQRGNSSSKIKKEESPVKKEWTPNEPLS